MSDEEVVDEEPEVMFPTTFYTKHHVHETLDGEELWYYEEFGEPGVFVYRRGNPPGDDEVLDQEIIDAEAEVTE